MEEIGNEITRWKQLKVEGGSVEDQGERTKKRGARRKKAGKRGERSRD